MRPLNHLPVNTYRLQYSHTPLLLRQFNIPFYQPQAPYIPKHLLLDHISDAVVYTNMDLRIQYLNKRAEEVYGISLAAATGRLFKEVIQYEYVNDTREQALQILQQTGTWQGKVVYNRKDKQTFHLLATVTFARDDRKKPIGLIASLKDITSEELTNEAISISKEEQRKDINRLLIQTQEQERNELGRELHDNINQILAAVKLQLEYSLDNYADEKSTVERCKNNIDEVIREIRNLSHRLVLPRFAETNLTMELQKTIENIALQQPVLLNVQGLNEALVPDKIKETVYRIIQEQLTNIIRHAKAKQACIRLYNDATGLFLDIEDDGVGFHTTQTRKGVGITNILNRVESYNGTVSICSAPGKGCRLAIAIPLPLNI